mgnify:CR=1 FL=1
MVKNKIKEIIMKARIIKLYSNDTLYETISVNEKRDYSEYIKDEMKDNKCDKVVLQDRRNNRYIIDLKNRKVSHD